MKVIAERGAKSGIYLIADGDHGWVYNASQGSVSGSKLLGSIFKFGYWTDPDVSVDQDAVIRAARLLATFQGEHWITLDDGRHILIEEHGAGAHPRGTVNKGEPPLGAPLSQKEAVQYLRQPEPHYDLAQEEHLVAEALPSHPVVSLTGDWGDADQSEIHPQLATLAEVAQDYPVAGAKLGYVGIYHGQAEPPSPWGKPYSWSGSAYAELATLQHGEKAIGFNPYFFASSEGVPSAQRNTDGITSEMQTNVAAGWFPPQANEPGWTAVHEYGHVVAHDLANNNDALYRQWVDTTDPELRLPGVKVDDSSISEYAKTGPTGSTDPTDERLAESFAGYYFGSDHWQAKATGNVLRSAYGRAPQYAGAPAQHSAQFEGHWVTLDDGRHVFIGEGGSGLQVHGPNGEERVVEQGAHLPGAETPYDTKEIIEARQQARASGPDTLTRYAGDPAREALQAKIAEEMYQEGAIINGVEHPVDSDRKAFIVMGPPAAGKSSKLAEPLARDNHARIIDADAAKEKLPEFNGGKGAGLVQEESSLIAVDAARRTVGNGDNLVLPVVGGTPAKVRANIVAFKKAGYDVHVSIVDLPANKAADRAVKRYYSTGRFVDPAYVLGVDAKPSKSYDMLRQEGLADSYAAYNGDVPVGQPIKLDASRSTIPASV